MLRDHTHSDGPDYTNLVAKYKCVKNRVKNSICRLQNQWWSNKAEEMHSCRDWKGLFGDWKKLSHTKSANVTAVRNSSGDLILCEHHAVNARWRENFSNLLNNTNAPIDPNILSNVPQHPVAIELADPTRDEVTRALMHFKKMKAPGRDGIMAELLQQGGPYST